MDVNKTAWRVPLGFLLAPVLPCTLAILPSTLATRNWSGAIGLIGTMIIVSLAITLVLAMPVYLLLKRYWTVGLVECLVSGTVIGVIPFPVLELLVSSGKHSAAATASHAAHAAHGWAPALSATSDAAVLGAAIGFAFWAIAFWSPGGRQGHGDSLSPARQTPPKTVDRSSLGKHRAMSFVAILLIVLSAVISDYGQTMLSAIPMLLAVVVMKKMYSGRQRS